MTNTLTDLDVSHYMFCRDFSVVLDLHTVTSKSAAMTQLTQQCKGVMLIANGLHDEVKSSSSSSSLSS